MEADKHKVQELRLKGIALVVAVIMASWAIHSYSSVKEREIQTLSGDRNAEARARKELVLNALKTYDGATEKRLYTDYWNTKLRYFLEVTEAANTMARAEQLTVYNAANRNFNNLHQGELVLLAGDRARKALDAFLQQVPPHEPDALPIEGLDQHARVLMLELKTELSEAWEDPFGELGLPERADSQPNESKPNDSKSDQDATAQ